MSVQWWVAVVGLVVGLVVLFGSWVRDRVRMGREEASQGVAGASDEWADTLHGIRSHLDVMNQLGDTGAIDMSWLRLHLDMEDIEEELHRGLTAVTDAIIDALLDDGNWDHAATDVRV